MNKKFLSTIAGITAAISMFSSLYAGAVEINKFSDDLSVYYNNKNVYENNTNKPIIVNDRTMVQIKPIFELMGFSADYNDVEKKAVFSNYDKSQQYVFIAENSNIYKVVGEDESQSVKNLDVPAMLYNDTFYVPLRGFCEVFGMSINWIAPERKVMIGENQAVDDNDNNVANTYNYQSHLGTWYYVGITDPKPDDYEPITVTDKGNNKAEIAWADGYIEQITFISDNIAHGDTSVIDYCSVEGPSAVSEERRNVPVVNVYDFTPVRDAENMNAYKRTTDTDRLIMAQWSNAVRNVEDAFISTANSANSANAASLSEEEAYNALKNWIGDLGTWVNGDENVLVCDGIHNCDGKDYYQFMLKGRVDDHLTTLTYYVISADGTDMFEGQCYNGKLNRWKS